jgi:ferritin-like protein
MSAEAWHEARETLPADVVEMHRAIRSLIEELEAVDWYAQRVAASGDAELREVLAHNRDEEKEHASMTLEWIRRRDPCFDTMLRRYLFRSGSIVATEERAEAAEHGAADGPRTDPSLGLGSLRAGAS